MKSRVLPRRIVFLTPLFLCFAIAFANATDAPRDDTPRVMTFAPAYSFLQKSPDTAASLSFFHAEGRDLVSDTTGEKTTFRGVVLNGLEFGSFEGHPYTGAEGTNYFKPRLVDFDAVQALGASIIRVPFEWARLVKGWKTTDPQPTTLDPVYLGILDEVVQRAGDRQIQVVFDMHDFLKYWSGQSAQVCVDTSVLHQQMLAQTWKLLAAHFASSQVVLGYDIQNEPVRHAGAEACSSCNWHAIAQLVVDAIRTADVNHLIIVEGPSFSLGSHWPIENGGAFITDTTTPPRVAYSPHVFFDLGNDSKYDDPGELNGPIGQWPYYMRDRLMPVLDWGRDNNVPIFLGETNVPCAANWAPVLEVAFANFLDPLHISATAWHYIDPAHCALGVPGCDLNLAACAGQHQLQVLARHPGGVYGQRGSFQPAPTGSRLYGDARVNPWDAGAGFFGEGIVLNFSATSPVCEGTRSTSVLFNQNNFAGVKFSHHYGVDTRRFKALTLAIFQETAGPLNFKIFTTNPRSDCDPATSDPIYPPTFAGQPDLHRYIPAVSPGQWMKLQIPLSDIVDPDNPIINGIVFQNMGSSQGVFYLDNIHLTTGSPRPFDFDADGKADVAVYRHSTEGEWHIIASSTGSATAQTWGGVPGDIIMPADYDGDDQTDVAIYRFNEGTWFIKNSSDCSVKVVQWGASTLGDRPQPGDYDGDGRADIAVWRSTTGVWWIINSSNGSIRTVGWGVDSDIPSPGDYDGDGKTDVAVWRPSTGTWFIINSSNGSVTIKGWGASSDKPVLGDFDGDGRTDVAVWRRSTGTWYIINSSNNSVTIKGWGNNSDKPVPGDFDGDGKTDVAVWRPSSGTWFINNSSNGSTSMIVWGVSGDVPVPSAFVREEVEALRPL